MREVFFDRRKVNKYLQSSTHELVDKANIIIKRYQELGYRITLRQLFYQFVKRNWIENSERAYNRLSTAISSGRLFGLVDWDAIEDRVRFLNEFRTDYESSQDFMDVAPSFYSEDVRRDQPIYLEVRLEKDAVANIAHRACSKWRVPYIAMRGYTSQSELFEAGKRIEQQVADGKRVVIVHLGDHDPSGIDMTRDTHSRLEMLSHYADFEFVRIALNMDQVEQYEPPPNPAKQTDSRYAEYYSNFGPNCWELDALDPEVIEQLIDVKLKELTDEKQFEAALDREATNREEIREVASNWDAALMLRSTDNGEYLF